MKTVQHKAFPFTNLTFFLLTSFHSVKMKMGKAFIITNRGFKLFSKFLKKEKKKQGFQKLLTRNFNFQFFEVEKKKKIRLS